MSLYTFKSDRLVQTLRELIGYHGFLYSRKTVIFFYEACESA